MKSRFCEWNCGFFEYYEALILFIFFRFSSLILFPFHRNAPWHATIFIRLLCHFDIIRRVSNLALTGKNQHFCKLHSFARSRHSLVRSLARAAPQWFQMIWNRRIEYWAIRSSAPPLFICSHRSLIRLLRAPRFARALRCAYSFARSLTHSLRSS